jgi:hypothetical protein
LFWDRLCSKRRVQLLPLMCPDVRPKSAEQGLHSGNMLAGKPAGAVAEPERSRTSPSRGSVRSFCSLSRPPGRCSVNSERVCMRAISLAGVFFRIGPPGTPWRACCGGSKTLGDTSGSSSRRQQAQDLAGFLSKSSGWRPSHLITDMWESGKQRLKHSHGGAICSRL